VTAVGDVVVVGGGITGLAAAWELSGSVGDDRPARVTVLESGTRLGGKIGTLDVAGQEVEAGPDAFIARVPEATTLCEELGLGEDLVAPATSTALIWTRGRLRRLPDNTVLGVPTSLRTLAASKILSFPGLARAGLDLVLPADTSTDDRSIAALVDSRLGREVRQRVVDPLLGGIHAGSTEHLSLAATAPQLDAASCEHRSLMRGLRALAPAPPAPPAAPRPVFLTIAGGLDRLVTELASQLAGRGVDLRTGVPVEELEVSGGRWQLSTPQGSVPADGVVLTLPSFVAADLLAPVAPAAASELDAIEHASVVLVTLVYPADAVPMTPGVSGFLVPWVDSRLMTACTWLSAKWPGLARSGQSVIRVSAGRWGDERALELGDDELVRRLRTELEDAMGIAARPDDAAVGRWPRSFPQYLVGHLERVARIRTELSRQPGLAVAGASYGGVGIPACVGQGRRAGRAVLDHLTAGTRRGG
jgi:oxygen-dependent protoporphyrinogen oxidase